MKILEGRDKKGRFVKGCIPHNKGKKCNWVTERNLKDNPAKKLKVKEKMKLAKLNKGKGYINAGYKVVHINGKRTPEHNLVWLKANQLHRLPPSCEIHHLDLNKLNNHIENLQLMPIREHRQFHALLQNNMIGANK